METLQKNLADGEEQARLLTLALAKFKRITDLNINGIQEKGAQTSQSGEIIKPEMDSKLVQCLLDKPIKVSKLTQTKPWKEKDPLAE